MDHYLHVKTDGLLSDCMSVTEGPLAPTLKITLKLNTYGVLRKQPKEETDVTEVVESVSHNIFRLT